MSDLPVQQLARWVDEHSPQISSRCSKFTFRSSESSDPNRGKGLIEITTPQILGAITFWNRGEVEIAVMQNVKEGAIKILEDRRLVGSEEISALLDRYVNLLVEMQHVEL